MALLWATNVGQAQTDERPTVQQLKTLYAATAAEFTAIDSFNQQEFELMPRSVLNWSNPERKTLAGGLFFWTKQSRPMIAMSAYPGDFGNYQFEFQSLTDRSFRVNRNQQPAWRPLEAGVDWKPLEVKKWTPHDSALVRRRQMRQIASEFTAKLVQPLRPEINLRLQATPVYRYPADKLPAECQDGAVFWVVQGTDPEVLLMIEAVQNAAEESVFHDALARATMVQIQVRREGNLFFETEWAVQGYASPYTIIGQPQ